MIRILELLLLLLSTQDKSMDPLTNLSFKLLDIYTFLENRGNLEQNLEKIAENICMTLQAKRCSIMLLRESEELEQLESELKVFARHESCPASPSSLKLEQSIGIHVAASTQPLLIRDIKRSHWANLANGEQQESPSCICVPIILSEQVVGAIHVSFPQEKKGFEERDLELLLIFRQIIGQALQISHLEKMVKSRFLELAVTRELLEEIPIENSVALNPNPHKFAKIVAKSFFKELTQAGFGPNQIIEIATEVLNLLQTTLDKHRQRLTRDDS